MLEGEPIDRHGRVALTLICHRLEAERRRLLFALEQRAMDREAMNCLH